MVPYFKSVLEMSRKGTMLSSKVTLEMAVPGILNNVNKCVQKCEMVVMRLRLMDIFVGSKNWKVTHLGWFDIIRSNSDVVDDLRCWWHFGSYWPNVHDERIFGYFQVKVLDVGDKTAVNNSRQNHPTLVTNIYYVVKNFKHAKVKQITKPSSITA